MKQDANRLRIELKMSTKKGIKIKISINWNQLQRSRNLFSHETVGRQMQIFY